MTVGIKDTAKLSGISVIACCAVFVSTLFLNYNMDLLSLKEEITTEAAMAMYRAQVATGKVTAAVSGGCLAMTSVVMLMFYVKNYIDAHGRELGILKALGYADFRIAKHFWAFGISVFAGCALGFGLAALYLPAFYGQNNADGLFPGLTAQVHLSLAVYLIGVPGILFSALSVLYAGFTLKAPVLDLLKERRAFKGKLRDREQKEMPFLKALKGITVRSRKALVFFVAFSAFCFSAMVQMAMSMGDLSSKAMAAMILVIGLILAFVTLLLSLSVVVKGNAKTVAMMRVLGYSDRDCGKAVLGGYRPYAYLGFGIGTVYQYLLLKIMVSVVFAEVGNVPDYRFDLQGCAVTLILFVLTYEMILYGYARRIGRLPVKSVMLE